MTTRRPHTSIVRQPAWGWAWGGLMLGAIAALLMWAPASWLANAVGRASQGTVQLADAQGTVWSGSARLVLSGGAGSNPKDATALPGRIHWTLRPAFTGLKAKLEASCCLTLPLSVALQPGWQGGTLQIATVDASVPLALLSGLGTPWNTVQPSGTLAIKSSGLALQWALGRWMLAGQLQMETTDFSVRLSTLQPVGSYRLLLQGQSDSGGDQPSVYLSTLSGPLLLSGQGQWSGGHLRFKGEASTSPPFEEALANLLNILGRRSGARSVITLG